MKSKRYPLEALIEIRTRDLEEAQQAFSKTLEATARARHELEQAREAVQRVETSIADLEERFRRTGTAQSVAAGFLEAFPARRALLDKTLQAAKDGLRRAERTLEAAEQQEEAARAHLAEARKELEVVERHKEEWAQQKRAKRIAAEDEQAEELAARRRPGTC